MTHPEQPQQPEPVTVEQAIQQAIVCYQVGQLQEAERLYRAILQVQPHHADANHNLGVVAVQVNRAEAGLPHFKAALEANPNQAQYWLSYIDALIQAGQTEVAREVLEQGRQHGLEGEAATSLAERLGPNTQEINALVALFGEGRYEEAATQAKAMTERFPQHGFGWKVSGGVLKQMGRSAEALAPLQKAAALSPGDAEAHFNLGLVFHDLGRLEEAEASYRRALEIRPDFAETLCGLGLALHGLGRLEEAEASYKRALELRPDFPEAHNNLGLTLAQRGKLYEAEDCYRTALKLKPDYADAHNNLGATLNSLDRLAEAEASHRHAIRYKPDAAELHHNLGRTLNLMGRLQGAETAYRMALQLKPNHVDALHCMGQLSLEKGRVVEAEGFLRQALTADPGNPRILFSLTQGRKARKGDAVLSQLLEVAERARNSATPARTIDDMCALHYALAKCYDDCGDYAQAFPHFLEGAKLKRSTLDYKASSSDLLFTAVRNIFNQTTMDRLRGAGDPSDLPIFVLGMPRSGTTLVEQIIASHPDVYGAGELTDLLSTMNNGMSFDTIKHSLLITNLALLDQEILTTWATEYVAGLRRRSPEAMRITDKMPINFLVSGVIHLMLPNAKIIHVSRNPVDTCLSCFTTLFRYGHGWSYDLAELGRHYVGYARLMQHWRSVLPAGAFLDLSYEDLVADQEGQTRRMIDYCGLEWDDACLDFHRNKRSVSTASLIQVRQPISSSSVERWRHYEKFLGPLLEALGELVPEHH